MSNSFKELKGSSKDRSKRISMAMLDDSRKHEKTRTDIWMSEVLRKSSNFVSAKRLESCGRSSRCGYAYCSTCRLRHAKSLEKRFEAHTEKYELDDLKVLERYRWVTILHSLERCDLEDIAAATKAARREFNNFKRKWKDTWAEGVFEYELVDMLKIKNLIADDGNSSRKRDVLLEMLTEEKDYRKDRFEYGDGISYEDENGLERSDYILFHSHFLMDAGFWADGNWADITDDLRKRWDGNYRVRLDRLYGTNRQSINNSFASISRYCFKNRTKFNYRFGEYRHEDDVENENMFSMYQSNNIFNIYESMSGKNNRGLLLGWESKK
jgi:hypothetical protein